MANTKKLQPFQGFSPKCFDFLLQLSLNNDKAWFEQRRDEYKELVQSPMLALERELGPIVQAIDPPVRIGRYAVSRIYRDTRFSKDKSPFRDNVWIVYRPPEISLSEYFAMFFEINPVGYSYGMGLYSPNVKFMEAFRKKALANPSALIKILNESGLNDKFALHCESYKRPKIKDAPEEILQLLNAKSFHFYRESGDLNNTYSADWLDELKGAINIMKDFYIFVHDIPT